jgi:hypothetical protein
MEKVAILTESQKDELTGQLYAPDSYFNPIQDCNGEWVISAREIEQCIYPQYDWIKVLPLIDWCEPVRPPFPPVE